MEKRLNNSEKDRLIATLDKLQHSLYGYMDPTSVAEVNNVVRFVTKAYRYYSSLSQRLHLIDVIETAQILADMLFGCNIIIGCLLKDILSINEQCGDFCWLDDKLEYVDETVIFQQEQQDGYAECMEFVRNCCNYSYLRDNFGKEMAEIASLSAKINIIDHQEIDQKQSHKIRQFFLSFSQCQEVIIIKLAEKIHLFGIINTIFNHDQKQEIARDMLEIYAPLAARFGLYRFKEILEDGSFAILYPGLRESLLQRITYLNAASKIIKDPDAIGIFMENIYNAVSMTGISVIVDGREKETYSIWKKMKGKKTKFERLSDIFAVRIITDTLANCYQILGIIHSTFSAVSEKFKDYISNPKANGYKSIHTVVLGPNLHPIETQIRTEQMHREAEFGDAAHWLYKQVDLKQSALKPIEFNNEKKPVASAANTLNQYDSPVVPTDEHDLFCFTPYRRHYCSASRVYCFRFCFPYTFLHRSDGI